MAISGPKKLKRKRPAANGSYPCRLLVLRTRTGARLRLDVDLNDRGTLDVVAKMLRRGR